jgi:hypothetical protein
VSEVFRPPDMSRRIGDDGPTFADLITAGLDPFDNAQRGILVQGLVAILIGGEVTPGWHEYDILAPDGTTIEVKSTATVQRWPAGPRGYQARWSLPLRRGWNAYTNVFRPDAGRWADVYVLHLLTAQTCSLDEWCDASRHRFFVLPVHALPPAKATSLSPTAARSLPLVREVGLSGLTTAVEDAARSAKQSRSREVLQQSPRSGEESATGQRVED